MELKGTLKKINDIVEKSNFKSRTVWLTTMDNPEYPQVVELQLHKDKVDTMNGIAVGAPIICQCSLRGREWTDPKDNTVKVFNSIVCWQVKADAGGQPAVVAQQPVANNAMQQQTVLPPEAVDDLPF